MYKVLLICQGGMSSSFVVKKIKQAFAENNEELQITAKSSMEIVDYIDEVNAVLVAPNVSYAMEDIEAVCASRGLEPIIIPMKYYGLMDGNAIREIVINS